MMRLCIEELVVRQMKNLKPIVAVPNIRMSP